MALSDSWKFAVCTLGLTVYALFGDDFRIAATHKDTDILFDMLTIICILVFLLEIVANSIAKDDYFGSFFFVLDFVPTCTLFLDLTWISSALFCQNMEGGSTLKTGRAGRAGARAGRTVRIIRLIRLVKVYKMYKVAVEQRERAKAQPEKKLLTRASTDTQIASHSASMAHRHSGGASSRGSLISPGDDHDEDKNGQFVVRMNTLELGGNKEDESGQEEAGAVERAATSDPKKPKNETRVGKKLSEMTTRRVIILVLVMLFGMPQFLPSSHGFGEFRSSAAIGMELVYDKWRKWCPMNQTDAQELPWCLKHNAHALPRTARTEVLRWWFERYLLTYIYTHHAGASAWTLTWVGIKSKSLTEHSSAQGHANPDGYVAEHLAKLMQLSQEKYLGMENSMPLSDWDEMYASPDWTAEIVGLSDPVKEALTEPWVESCLDFTGVSVIPVDVPTPCSLDKDLRCSEVEYFVPATRTDAEEHHVQILFAFDSRGITQFEAGLSMLQTVFICCAVGIGAMTFSNDANQLLLKPIERMISKMESIKDNPLEAMRLGDLEYRREEIENSKRKEQMAKRGKLRKCCARFKKRRAKEPMETVILEKTIIKLGGLLALGFGEAGAEIIGHNINMSGGTSAGVNAMVPGQKVDAIIGFCHIRHFAHATQVLKEKVMLFVNQVGEIVHGCVDDYHGAPNKNMGDAFLLVWRLSGVPHERQKKLADMAIMSFVRIVAEINKSPLLAEYRGHPGMLQRVQNFRVALGFGLHCGWAIEGAIGSDYKIDASYLSPNVNVASRLEAATKEFNTWILMSHFMIGLCSPEMALYCRLIDHVTVKGSKHPVRVYTIDLDTSKLEIETKSMDKVIKNRFKVRQLRELRKGEKWSDCYRIWEAFRLDYDIVLMRSTFSSEFFKRFFTAYRNYEAGEWLVARDLLFTCHFEPLSYSTPVDVTEEEWPSDGPTATLLRFMETHDFWPPQDWRGHRELTL